MNRPNKIKYIFIALMCLGLIFGSVAPTFAQGDLLGPGGMVTTAMVKGAADVGTKISNWFSPALWAAQFLQLFNTQILGWAVKTVAGWLNGVITATSAVNNQAIIIGWIVLRDFANMFFILMMLIISIATILRYEEYGARRMLVRIIIVALLINFSRLFAYAVIDFSHVFVNTFLNAFRDANGSIDIAGALAQGLNLQLLYNVDANQVASGANNLEANVIMSVFMNTVILVVVLFAFLAACLLFLVRLIWLWFLVMTAPIAFLGYMVPWPMVSNWWREWWTNLFKWAFFAPIYLFFIYITVVMIQSGALNASLLNPVVNSGATVPGMDQIQSTGITMATSPNMLLQMTVIVGFLIGGLLLAVNMAGKFGQTALKIGTSTAALAAGGVAWASRKGAAMAGRATQRRYDAQVAAGKTPSATSRYANLRIQRFTAGSQATEHAAIEARKSQLKNQYGDNKVALQAKLLATLRPAEKTAIVSRLEEISGGMKSENAGIQKKINAAAVTATDLGFRPKSRPDLAAEGSTPGANAQKAVADVTKKLTTKDAENLSSDAIDPAAVGAARASDALTGMLQGLRPGVLAKITSDNDAFASQFRTRMQNMANGLGQNFDQFVNHIETVLGNAELANTLRNNPAAKTRYQFSNIKCLNNV